MKNRHFSLFLSFLFFLIFIFTLTFQSSQAQWTQTNGPEGGGINYIISNNNKLYAATQNGIFVSSNNGINWEEKNQGLEYLTTYTMTALNDIIFAGNERGIYRSTNNGESWSMSHDDYTFSMTTDGTNIFATLGYDGIYMTTDKGDTWNNIGLDDRLVNVVLAKGNILYAGTSDAVYFTTNKGETWTMSYNGLPSSAYIRDIVIKESNLFVSVSSEGIYRSTNNGESWTFSGNGVSDLYAHTLFVKDNLLFAGTHRGVYVSTNNGNNWEYSSTGMTNISVGNIQFYNNMFFAGTEVGIYSSPDSKNWTMSSNGIRIVSINSLVKHGIHVYAGGYNGVYKTNNNGNNWSKLDFIYAIENLFSGNGYLYALTFVYNGFYRTNNEGLDWDYVIIDSNNLLVNFLAVKDNYLFAMTTKGIYRSSNNGESWNNINNEFIDYRINSCIVSGNSLYIGTSRTKEYYGKVLRSSNNGANWIPIGDSINSGIKVFGTNAETIYAGDSRTLYTFTGNGENWDAISGPEEEIGELIIHQNSLIAGTYKGIYISTNNGIDWINKNQGFNNITTSRRDIKTMVTDNGYIFASQDYASIWKRSVSELIGEPVSVNPTDYILKQNYPNPFNPVTNIEFSLPISGNVKLDIYDITGKLIASLLNQEFNTGSYNVAWNASNTASGIYFYKLTTKYFAQTKKMMLVK